MSHDPKTVSGVARVYAIEPPGLADYPRTASGATRLRFALRYATLAPSTHNTQPWLFKVGNGFADVLADRSRSLPVVDPNARELTISCGAVIHHLCTVLLALGEALELVLLPEDTDPDLLATVQLRGPAEPSLERRRWLNALCARRTVRFAFEPRVPSPTSLSALTRVCCAEGAALHILDERQREVVTDLIAEGDRIQLASKEFRRELARWLRPNQSRSDDGIPGYAEGLHDPAAMLGPFIVRTFDVGRSQAAKDRELAEHSPALAVLSTPDDRPRSWLAAGAALSAVLLEATSLGLAASFLNQPIEVAELRPRVAGLIGGRTPQLVLRLGRYAGGALHPTPRRSLDDVIT